MIVCASRRTDIPAFQSEWFLSRLRAKNIVVKNPIVDGVYSKIDLSPENVDCIVFMSKNPEPIVKHLPEIGKNYEIIFQITITPYGKDIEKNVPEKKKVIDSLKSVSEAIGRERTIWRYDPILINHEYSIEKHIDRFEEMCSEISEYSERCVFSFVDVYPKLEKGFSSLGIRMPDEEERKLFVDAAKEISSSCGVDLVSCCEDTDVEKGCLSEKYMKRLGIKYEKSPALRDGCRCVKAIDIGTYSTCGHGCVYCYANRFRFCPRKDDY